MKIQVLDQAYQSLVDEYIRDEWAGPMMVSKGKQLDTRTLPGFAAAENGTLLGVALYHLSDGECELAVLGSLKENHGAGTALVSRLREFAKEAGCTRLWLITTNDNTHAIRFYQKYGFSLKAVHFHALTESRRLKPGIPLAGNDGIPLEHEFEFELNL